MEIKVQIIVESDDVVKAIEGAIEIVFLAAIAVVVLSIAVVV